MKLKTIAAGLTLGLLATAPATAKGPHDNGQGRHDEMRGDRHDEHMRGGGHGQGWNSQGWNGQGWNGGSWNGDRHDRGRHEGWRVHHDNGHHYGWRNSRHCSWTWRHHRRMRVCW